MKMRTRFLPRMLNSEVEEYLEHNDIIIVPVGTVEMHGGFPLDAETVISEAVALKMAESCDGLVLPNLQYFYAGATASGRGTVQVGVREGIDYLYAIADSLLRSGFKRQIYLSAHGPAHITVSPVVRDFYDHTGNPILYMDLIGFMFTAGKDVFRNPTDFHTMTVGAYKILGRLEDVPLTTEFDIHEPQTCAPFNDLINLGYQSGAVGYCFQDTKDHMPTPAIPDEETREKLAEEGAELIEKLVEKMNVPHIVGQLRAFKEYDDETAKKKPWVPSEWNRKK